MPHGGRSASGAGVALCGRARRGGRAGAGAQGRARLATCGRRCSAGTIRGTLMWAAGIDVCRQVGTSTGSSTCATGALLLLPPDGRSPHPARLALATPACARAACGSGGMWHQAPSGLERSPSPGLRVQPSNLRQRQCRGVRGLESAHGTCQSLRTCDPRSDMRQRAACPSPACLHSGQRAACGHKKLGSMP